MSLFGNAGIIESSLTLFYNTNTPMDIMTGNFVLSKNNWLLNGGLSYIFCISGLPGYYKTNECETMMANALNIYPESQACVYDIELNKDANKKRYDTLAKRTDTYVSDRVTMIDSASYDMDKWWTLTKNICKEKEKNKKDYIVETPFVDLNGQYIKTWIPTFMFLDSWSALTSEIENEMLQEVKHVSDGSLNTIYLKDANIKNAIFRHLPSLAVRYGIYFILTSHIGKRHNLTGRPEKKQHQFMSQSEGLKNTGSSFNFLTPVLVQSTGSKTLQDNDKHALYPYKNSSPNEINEVTNMVVRSKRPAGGGVVMNMVASQQEGILTPITWFHYLKEMEAGITGKGNYKCSLYPELSFTRKNIRENISQHYELERALQILGEFNFIKKYWKTDNLSVNFNMTSEELSEKLIKNKKPLISDILNSRGYWTYNKKEKRPHLSIYDIINLINKD